LTEDVAVRAPLTIAVVQPRHEPGNLTGNARQHADAVERAGARVVVFPELSLTGYDLDADAVRPDDDALAPLVRACAATGSIALAGAPVADEDGGVSIATLRVDADDVRVAYRKTHLGAAEQMRFRPGPGPLTTLIDGWRTGLGICKDTGVAEHVRQVAELDIDLYVAGLVHRPEELPIQDVRGAEIARRCRAHVAFASCAGRSGGGYDRTAGTSTVWSPSGKVLARAGAEPGQIAKVTIAGTVDG
jgi:predicted amidohydrolase